MLEEFWSKKKHLVQFLGILIAIGAIFLSIGTPQDASAAEALQNIQLGWLVIITAGHLLLFWELFSLMLKFERRLEAQDTLSMFAAGIALFILTNLWIYIFHIYKKGLIDLLSSVQFSWAIGAAFIYLTYKVFMETYNLGHYNSTFYTFVLSAPALSLWDQLRTFSFSLSDYMYGLTAKYVIFAIVVFGGTIWFYFAQARKIESYFGEELYIVKNGDAEQLDS
jgi:hypothetical protein